MAAVILFNLTITATVCLLMIKLVRPPGWGRLKVENEGKTNRGTYGKDRELKELGFFICFP